MKPNELALHIAKSLMRKLGQDIIILNVGHLTTLADYFVIASGRNVPHVRALAEEVDDKLAAEGISPRRTEGLFDARWVVLDYASVLVHIFHVDEREYYHIERLWMDGGNSVPLPADDAETEA